MLVFLAYATVTVVFQELGPLPYLVAFIILNLILFLTFTNMMKKAGIRSELHE